MAARNKKEETTAVATREPRQMIPIEQADEAMLAEMEGVEGAGISTNPEDLGIPFLFIAQTNSKPMKKQRPEYIEGLEIGNAYNTVTGEMYDAENEGVPFVPCFFRALFNEWTPQDQGGGFHGSHPLDTPLLKNATPVKGADGSNRRDIFLLEEVGHELVLTHEYWGVIPDSWTQIIVPMSSTNLGASKKIQGLLNAQKIMTPRGLVRKPSFFTTFSLRTAYEKNESGDWYKWVPAIQGPTSDETLRAFCKKFAQDCIAGQKKAATPPEAGDTRSDAGTRELPV